MSQIDNKNQKIVKFAIIFLRNIKICVNVNPMKIKLSDIAQQTGFSVNTVSRALRGDKRISEGTASIIKMKAEELGYIRNHVAGSMRSSRTNTIGVVSADSSNPFFAEVLLGIEDTARKMNFHILLINTEEQWENEYEAVKLLLGRQVDGLIIIPVLTIRKTEKCTKPFPYPLFSPAAA